MHRSTTRRTRTALALAALAVVIPTAASARPYPEPDTGFAVQAKPIAARDFSMGSQASLAVVRPDDRAGVRGAGVENGSPQLDPAYIRAMRLRDAARNMQYGPSELDPAYIRALELRGKALNEQYGPSELDPAYIRALQLRGQALNEQYGTQTAVRPDDRSGIRSVGTVGATQSSGGFDFGDAVIGAIGAFGLSLLVAGGMLLTLHVVHQRRDRVAAL
jgi:hypothetical protein